MRRQITGSVVPGDDGEKTTPVTGEDISQNFPLPVLFVEVKSRHGRTIGAVIGRTQKAGQGRATTTRAMPVPFH